jgi:hypothetical protein
MAQSASEALATQNQGGLRQQDQQGNHHERRQITGY